MAWTGKIVGGVLGSLLGPYGILIGAAIGHQYDKAATSKQETGMLIQTAFFGCLAKMARADGNISKEEILAVESIIRDFGYTPEMRNAAIGIFRRAKDDNYSAADYLNQLAEVISYDRDVAISFIIALHSVAISDSVLHPSEKEILFAAERAFHLPHGTVEKVVFGNNNQRSETSRPSGSKLAEAYAVLGCAPEMDFDEIKKVYRQKCLDFHPDKLASKGLPDEFMKYAHEQLTKINQAYDLIKKNRN